jgi:hypothetical protein
MGDLLQQHSRRIRWLQGLPEGSYVLEFMLSGPPILWEVGAANDVRIPALGERSSFGRFGPAHNVNWMAPLGRAGLSFAGFVVLGDSV